MSDAEWHVGREDSCEINNGSSRTCERGSRGCNVKHCKTCLGLRVIDDRGFPLTGQPYFDTQPCPECSGGTGKSVGMRIAESAGKSAAPPESLWREPPSELSLVYRPATPSEVDQRPNLVAILTDRNEAMAMARPGWKVVILEAVQ